MLVLSRKIGEEIVIGDNIRVTLLAISGDRVRLGLAAPADICILRDELHMASAKSGGSLCSAKVHRGAPADSC